MTTEPIPLLPRISDYPDWHAARQPDAIALSLYDLDVSYLQLSQRVNDLARALLAAGVGKGDRVATLQTPRPEYVIAFLATASIGAIWLGLNPRYQLPELSRAVLDAEPPVLLMRTKIGERRYDREAASFLAAEIPRRVVVFDGDPLVPGADSMQGFIAAGSAVSTAALEAARSACGGRDPCLIVYTSGSSGSPKGALLHHEGIARVSRAQVDIWGVDPFCIVNYFPINHVGCVVDCTTPSLVAGGTLHFMEQFEPKECLELMVRKRATIWGSVPSAFRLQTELDGFEGFDLSAVQLIAWGGGAMSETLIARLRRICPRLCTNYGMTESCGTVTSVLPTDDLDILAHSVGQPIDGVEVRLTAMDDSIVARGETGEIQVRSGHNLLGYWRSREATIAAFTADGFLRTGDLAVERPDGRYRLVGRLTDMYKSGGYNVYPREIEAVLEGHPAITLAAVVAAPDPLWQEVGIAYVVALAPITASELAAYCRSLLAAYKIPKRIIVEADLPLLPIGKVDKRVLRARAAELHRSATTPQLF
jgi:acyl-CoA synthetase (AMP-forming)/AMP-acid ligase II